MKPGKDSQVWATYTQEFYEGKSAVTTHKLGKGTVTYVGVDSTDGLLERDILKKLYLENAVNASLMLPEDNDRRISLSVKADDASGNLYIVAENNFPPSYLHAIARYPVTMQCALSLYHSSTLPFIIT